MKSHGKSVSEAHVVATMAEEQLNDLARIDGVNNTSGHRRRTFFRLKISLKNLPIAERIFANRGLDYPNKRGHIPSHDIAPLMKKRSR